MWSRNCLNEKQSVYPAYNFNNSYTHVPIKADVCMCMLINPKLCIFREYLLSISFWDMHSDEILSYCAAWRYDFTLKAQEK